MSAFFIMETNEANNPGRPSIPNRQGQYSKIAKKADLVINTLFNLLESKNENIRLGAAKVLLNKIIPDIRATELDIVKENPPYIIKVIGGGYTPPI